MTNDELELYCLQQECSRLGVAVLAYNKYAITDNYIQSHQKFIIMNDQNANSSELSFGEKAVGISFNPGGNPEVESCKRNYARIIDDLNDLRNTTSDSEVKRLCSVAITEAQGAQMWAVKAITWKS